MNIKKFLLTTSVMAGVLFSSHQLLAQAQVTTEPALNPSAGNATAETVLPNAAAAASLEAERTAAASMIENVNMARLALEMKNRPDAERYIGAARQQATNLQATAKDYRSTERVQTGRFTYEYNNTTADYYYPIASGMIEQKEFATGPFWSQREGVAVKNAEVAYVSLAVNTKDALEKLTDADAAIKENNFDKASDQLDELVSNAIKSEKVEDLPLVKAQDNLALAKGFIRAKNYDGARFALNHAEDAIEAVSKDEKYNAYASRINSIHAEVKQLQTSVAQKDPTLLDKAEAKLTTWWKEMKSWTKETM